MSKNHLLIKIPSEPLLPHALLPRDAFLSLCVLSMNNNCLESFTMRSNDNTNACALCHAVVQTHNRHAKSIVIFQLMYDKLLK